MELSINIWHMESGTSTYFNRKFYRILAIAKLRIIK